MRHELRELLPTGRAAVQWYYEETDRLVPKEG